MNLTFDSLVQDLKDRLDLIKDHRSNVNTTQTLANILMSGFAVFSVKDPSLLKFVKDLKNRTNNLRNIFHITQRMSDTNIRKVIDKVKTKELKKLFKPYMEQLDNEGVLDDYEYIENRLIVPMDGTQYFVSKTICCKNCLTKHHKDGSTTFHHNALCASIVCPNTEEVFPLGIEDIARQDGKKKNDCELNAVQRLIPQIIENLPDRKILLGGDAIYANGPLIRFIREQQADIRFIFAVKPGSQGYLFLQFERLEKQGKVQTFTSVNKNKKHVTKYVNGLMLNGQNNDILVNFLHFEEHDLKKGTVKTFSWITDIGITVKNHVKITKAGRARWKIENETFNTLKNQGYHFEHNFGHGEENLAANFSVLMLLAFLFDQIQQRINLNFKLAKLKAGSRIALWEKVRQYFDLIEVQSMDFIYQLITGKIKMRVQFII